VNDSPGARCLLRLVGVSDWSSGSALVKGRSLQDPRHAAGAGVDAPTPDHSGTVQPRKGGPLWLQ